MRCLMKNNVGYGRESSQLIQAAHRMKNTPLCDALKTIFTCYFFHKTEEILASRKDPLPSYRRLLLQSRLYLQATLFFNDTFSRAQNHYSKSLEKITGEHYGNLFKQFDKPSYFEEPFRLLKIRLVRNGFDFQYPKGKTALDAGCGGGRYTVALKRLGFSKVVGVDFSKEGIRDAECRVRLLGSNRVAFKRADVLHLPYPEGSFDFVFSNGVLHHTKDMGLGIRELLRVLKKGGRGFIYLIESPGGIFWDSLETLREVMRGVPSDLARKVMNELGVKANRIFYILDHILVPINILSTPQQVKSMLEKAGAVNIRRLTRGADFDRVEKIFQGTPYHRIKFGVGENRFFFEKGS